MVAREKDFGGLAGEQAERRDVADRVAREKRRERAPQGKSGARRQAPAPAFRSDDEPEASEREDEDEAPADAPDGLEDVGNTGALGRVRKQRGPAERRGDGERALPPAIHGLSARRGWLRAA